MELSEFDVQYEIRKALKAQDLADFVAEMTAHNPPPPRREGAQMDHLYGWSFQLDRERSRNPPQELGGHHDRTLPHLFFSNVKQLG